MSQPMEGIVVVELDDFVSAPVAGRVLADMGAMVIKVERKTGNNWRNTGISMGRTRFTQEENPIYDLYNSGKKHIAIDLKTPEGLAIMEELMQKADVFLTNMRVKALERLGLDEPTVRAKYPRCVYAIGLGYGEKGPDKDQPAFDTSAFWARGGFLRDQGTVGDKYLPVCPPASVGDTFTGMTLACEICSALYQRSVTGEGQTVKSGLFHNACYAFGSMQVRAQQSFGEKYPKTREAQGAPHGNYETADGEWLYIASGYAETLIPKIIEMSGHPELKDDPRYQIDGGCPDRIKLTIELMQTEMKKRTLAEWLELGKKYDIPMARLQHYEDLPNDPQVIANGYLDYVTYENGHQDYVANTPIEMENVVKAPTEATPKVGRDTDEVLKIFGFTEEKLQEYKEKGFIL